MCGLFQSFLLFFRPKPSETTTGISTTSATSAPTAPSTKDTQPLTSTGPQQPAKGDLFFVVLVCLFLAHLSQRLMGKLIVYQSLLRPPGVRPSSVRQHFQTSSPPKPLGQLNSNFIWRLLRTWEQKFVPMVLVTWPRWPPCPYMEKKPLKIFSSRALKLIFEYYWSQSHYCHLIC